MKKPTVLWPAKVRFDPRHPEACNPAFDYLSWAAWPDINTEHQANRALLTSSLVAAVYKQARLQMPPETPKGLVSQPHGGPDLVITTARHVQRKNIAPTIHKALRRIHQRGLPAVLMVLHHWVQKGLTDLSATRLTPDQQARLADTFETAADIFAATASKLRRLGLVANVPDMPRSFSDIGRDAWADMRPALAMLMVLPISWRDVALRGGHYNADTPGGYPGYGAIARLCYDPSWVPEAISNAGLLVGQLAQVLDQPPTALLNPYRKNVRNTDARWVVVDKRAMAIILNSHLPPEDLTELLTRRGL
jgi:hypothetical protein